MWQSSYNGEAILYLVSTPIGNMEDITLRAVNILKSVDVIFSEDTRVTQNLLNYYNIKKKLIALHDHNEDSVKERVLEYLCNGKMVALVTDRGTPIISDPGYKTVKYVTEEGYNVVSIGGLCAFLPALVVSGLPPKPFTFYGFLSSKEGKRKKELEALKFIENTLIFYEAPHRILSTMKLMLDIFGDRNVSVSREITKKFESVYRGCISALLPSLENIKGEFVIVVEGYSTDSNNSELAIYESVSFYVDSGMSSMDAIKVVSREKKIPKSVVYSIYHRRVK